MAIVTLATLRDRAKTQADMVNSDFLSDDEWNRFINASADELHDIIVQKFGDDYYVSEQALTTVASTADYALPDDFYKLIGVDIQVNGQPQSLLRWEFKDRNSYWNILAYSGEVPRYRIVGNNLRLYPIPTSVLTGTVYYVPTRPTLDGDSDELNYPGGWEEYIVVDAAIKAGQKEETDVSVLMASKQALIQRIEAAAANRDAGEPSRVADVRSDRMTRFGIDDGEF